MNNILIVVAFEALAPFMLRLGAALSAQGWNAHYAAFTPKEYRLLRLNAASPIPPKPSVTGDGEGTAARIADAQLLQMLHFTIRKFGGDPAIWLRRARHIESCIDRAMDERRIDAVFAWNGDEYIAAIAARLAQLRGLPVIYGENGYFPNTLQIDPEGVNARSSIRSTPFDSMRAALAETESLNTESPKDFGLPSIRTLSRWDRLLIALRRQFDPSYGERFPELTGSSRARNQAILRFRESIPLDNELPQSPYVFIPFQVHDDTQILLNSPLFDSVTRFFEFAHAAVKKALGDNYRIVVKEHPEDLGRADYSDLKQRYPDVLWLRKCNLDALLDRASIVLVVNSSVGLQSIARHRPTVTFGSSFYAREGLSFHVDALDGAVPRIREAAKGYTDAQIRTIDLFVEYLKHRAFVSVGWKDESTRAAWSVASRIAQLLGSASKPSQSGSGVAG